jgi:alpha-L-arabinofuranosidase
MILRAYHSSLCAAIALASAFALSLPAQQTAQIDVFPRQILGPVNRLVFGQNIEAGDNARIFSQDTTNMDLIRTGTGLWDPINARPVPEVVNQSRAVNTSILRYPGGCLAHNFDWRKTVGPSAKASGWLFGLDEYLTLCTSIGAVPLITVSDYVLPADQMPENAAQLVEYLNSPADPAHPWAMKRKQWGHPAPYNVVWFELGNESIHGNHRLLPRRQFTPEEYAAYANATAKAMRKVDPRVKLGIVIAPGPGNDVDGEWNRTVVRLAGSNADFAIVHMYAPKEPDTALTESVRMQAMMVAPQHIEERLKSYHQMIQHELGHDLPLAISEFNGGLDPTGRPYRFSYANALESADLLRLFLKPELNVAMASYWNFLNGAFGMLRTTSQTSGGLQQTEEPPLLLYKMWAQHLGTQLIKAETQSPRADFPGAGSEPAAIANDSVSRRKLQQFDLASYTSTAGALWPRLLNVQIQMNNSDLSIHIRNLSRSIFPVLATIPRPKIEPAADAASGLEFELSFDARFTPDPGTESAPMGLGLVDSRGWKATHSGVGIDEVTSQWKHLVVTYSLTSGTPSVDLIARLLADGRNVAGTFEVRNLAVADFLPAHGPAYPLLTSSASTSPDGRKVYLMVINKSADDSIAATVQLAGYRAESARYWEINGPSLQSSTGVAEVVHGAALPLTNPSAATHLFPAHSMTAIEFTAAR